MLVFHHFAVFFRGVKYSYVHPTLELKKDNMNKLSSLLAVK